MSARRFAAALAVLAVLALWLFGRGGAVDAISRGPAAKTSTQRVTASAPGPDGGVLRPGMSGTAVRTLQQRLTDLHYYPGPVNGRFGRDTLEAVWAFKEVQGISTGVKPNEVNAAVQRALAAPRQPRVLVPGGGRLRIEVDLARETLVLYRGNKVDLISHVSAGGGYYFPCPWGGTCGPAITPDGDYTAQWYAPGWLHVPLGRMYNSVFFIGSVFAIHGDKPIPLRPASHGCVRVPVDVAKSLHTRIQIAQSGGTPIYIRGHAPKNTPAKPQPHRAGGVRPVHQGVIIPENPIFRGQATLTAVP
jgi:lipoprotein-anchoring transpeptidase ErfK/SrfK